MREYRVKVSVTNNLLLTAIENAGFSSQAEFARSADISSQTLNALVGLRVPPIGVGGSFSPLANKIMEALNALPTELWTEEQLTMALPKSSSTGTLNIGQLTQLQNRMTVNQIEHDPSESAEKSLIAKKVQEILEGLTPRERKVIQLRFGMDECEEHTYEEIGTMFDLTRERVRQIEAKALRKIKEMNYKGKLKLGEIIE
jgi:RNA polymerase sigma factor (sigma-70 family)